jgi:hypothetical protein
VACFLFAEFEEAGDLLALRLETSQFLGCPLCLAFHLGFLGFSLGPATAFLLQISEDLVVLHFREP